MPITITLTKGVVQETLQNQLVKDITDSFLQHHNLEGNSVMTPNVTTQLHIQPLETTFSGGKPISGAWVEIKVPSFALADRTVQRDFFSSVTEIIYKSSGKQLPKEQIWTNVLHTVDGTWNMDAVAMTNEELLQKISQG
ncbi:hypothetical protein MNBD_GAMMA12-1956 [hydrothermal vent metagenome]|uniref:4-oxalocrotonate tautomerase domain-containing protein n=1 Tax=hydrothermal vent metagenome TaxID=652676 RepID=A0A3B0Z341_9ZZZZ